MTTDTDTENRETWQARLWIANDKGLAEGVREIIGSDTPAVDVPYSAAREVRDFIEEALPPVWQDGGLLGDIVGLWLDRVDWHAVAEASAEE